MKHKTVMILIILSSLISACSARVMRGSGEIVSEERNVASFDRIDVCCGMHLYLEQGETTSVEIETDDNLLPEIDTQVIAGRLNVNWEDNYFETNYRPSQPVNVYITVSDVRSVELSGGGKLFTSSFEADRFDLSISGGGFADIDELTATTFDVDLSGGSDLTVNQIETGRIDISMSGGGNTDVAGLQTNQLNINSSGGGEVTLAGSAATCDFETSGGSNISADDLQCVDVDASLSGGGTLRIWAIDGLDVEASGGSKVLYYGQPQLNSDTSGGSKVSSLGER